MREMEGGLGGERGKRGEEEEEEEGGEEREEKEERLTPRETTGAAGPSGVDFPVGGRPGGSGVVGGRGEGLGKSCWRGPRQFGLEPKWPTSHASKRSTPARPTEFHPPPI